MGVIVDFRRRRRISEAVDAELAQTQFWRKSMVRSSIVMGAIVVVALGTLIVGFQRGLFDYDWGMWVLVLALFSVFGLTKVIMANLLFYVLLQEETGVSKSAGPPPDPGLRIKAPRRMARPLLKRRYRRRSRIRWRAAAARSE
jgi:hypothetical protein